MSNDIWFNLFKARENEIGIVYENNTLVIDEDFTFKAGIPYQLSLSKKTADTGTQYISIRAVVNEWAIQNSDKFSHLKHVHNADKQIERENNSQSNDDNDL